MNLLGCVVAIVDKACTRQCCPLVFASEDLLSASVLDALPHTYVVDLVTILGLRPKYTSQLLDGLLLDWVSGHTLPEVLHAFASSSHRVFRLTQIERLSSIVLNSEVVVCL